MTLPNKLHRANVYVIEREKQVAHAVLPDGCRFVMLVRGQAPLMVPIEESGSYEIDGDDISPGQDVFPVLIIVADLAHVPAFLKMKEAQVSELVDRALVVVRGGVRPGEAPGELMG